MIKSKRDAEKERDIEMKVALDSVIDMKREIMELTNLLEEKEEELKRRSNDTDILHELYEKGIIDIDGNPL